MHPILPAVIPTSVEAVLKLPEQLRFAPRIQLDIVDGVCAQPASWPYEPVGSPEDIATVFEHFEVQVDIMALEADTAAASWAAAGAQEIVVHIETLATLEDVLALKHQHDVAVWVAANDDTPLERLHPYLQDVAGVQLMGIHTIGSQGQPLSPRVIDNIQTLRAHDAAIPIQIDGSVNADTILQLREAGATQFVVGSAIVGAADPRAAYQALCAQVQAV